jgi:hypothetical protein
MWAARILACGVLCVSTAIVGSAAGPVEDTQLGGNSAVTGDQQRPRCEQMPSAVGRQLRSAYKLALSRVQTRESCGRLFEDVGADGVEALSATLYAYPREDWEKKICNGTVAFSQIGAEKTVLCFSFANESVESAANTLVYLALHHVGLKEQPVHQDAMTPEQISLMVEDGCGLSVGEADPRFRPFLGNGNTRRNAGR